MINDYGMKSVVLRNIDRAISAYRLKTVDELNEIIDSLKIQLEDSRELMEIRINKLSSCQHVFKNSTFTDQRRFLGYARVYERQCNHCGHIDVFQHSDGAVVELPEWTKNAKQQYYNNQI